MLPGGLDRLLIPGIGVAHHTHAGIGGQHALQAAGCLRRAVCHDHLPGMLAVANAHPASVVEGYPGCAAHGVDQGVQDGPIADRIAAILHPLGLPVGRGDRAGIQVVAADHDGSLDDTPLLPFH